MTAEDGPRWKRILAPEAARCLLLQVPMAFSINDDEVTKLIEAGGNVMRALPEAQVLMGLLPAAAQAAPPP